MGLKMKHIALIVVVAAVFLGIIATVISVGAGGSSSSGAVTSSGPYKAVVVLNVGGGIAPTPNVLVLEQENDKAPVRITGTITNLIPVGKHGFHVHESGNVTGGCGATGGHYNPFGKDHGAQDDEERHIGDLGNIEADAEGKAVVNVIDNKISLVGEHSIIGRAIVVHEGTDDLGKGGDAGSKKTGNAGGRRVCGVIGTIFMKS